MGLSEHVSWLRGMGFRKFRSKVSMKEYQTYLHGRVTPDSSDERSVIGLWL